MPIYTKKALQLGKTSQVLLLSKKWLDRNGSPTEFLVYENESDLRIVPVPDSTTASRRAKTEGSK